MTQRHCLVYFKESVRNGVAFDKRLYDGYQRDVLQVAHEAHQRINNEARAKGQRTCNVKLQGLVAGADTMDTELLLILEKSLGNSKDMLRTLMKP